jgi:undecaprenyl-diphosphatase
VIGVLFLRGRRADAVRVAVTMIGAIALTVLFKVVFDRPRPPPMVRTMGFPSGHVAVGACFYLGLAFCVPRALPRVRALALVAATVLLVAVTASRLVLGNHYPSDVAGGLALAGIVLWGAGCLPRR